MSLSLILFFLLLIAGIIAMVQVDLAWGVCLYIAIYFIFPVARWWYTLPRFRYVLLIGLILVVGYLLQSDKYKEQKIDYFPQLKWLAFMVVMMLIISFYAVWPEHHTKYTIIQIKQLIFLYVAYKVIDTYKKFEWVLWSYLYGCLYVAYLIWSAGRGSSGRVEGINMADGQDANMTAAVLITALPILFAFFLKQKGLKRLFSIALFLIILNGIILINSRGAIIGLGIGLFYFIASLCFSRNSQLNSKQKLAVVFAFIAFIGTFSLLADKVFWKRMSTLTQDNPEDIEGAGRTYFWLKSYELAKQYPLGVGVDGFEYLSPLFLEEKYLSRRTGTRAIHSTYFEALSDFGFPGLLLLAGFILSSIRLVERTKKEIIKKGGAIHFYYLGTALESSYFAFLIAAAFINRLYAEVFYWLMLFMACYANTTRKVLYSSENTT